MNQNTMYINLHVDIDLQMSNRSILQKYLFSNTHMT